MLLLLPISCNIKEDTSKCEQTSSLYIVVNAEDKEPVNGATIYLFNNDGRFLTSKQVSAEDIAGKVPVNISYKKGDKPWAVVWGNLGDSEQILPPTTVTTLESLFIIMKKDAKGYAIPMDHLFFGSKRLSGAPVEEVEIARKTGRIAITVKGLPQGIAEQYYFTMETAYGDYNFAGTPLADKMTLKLPGIYSGNDFVTPEAYHSVDFPSGIGAIVKLYKIDAAGDILLATADKDTNGHPIVLPAGQTTNVLIQLKDTGELIVTVVITGPDEIYQWNEW